MSPFQSLICFFELASIIAESSCYCQSSDKNSVCRSFYDIHLQTPLGADEVNGDFVVTGHYHTFFS
jgi:hypothetical protein